MQQGCKEGADTAEGGEFFYWQLGSEGGNGGEPTHQMGQTEETEAMRSPCRVPSRRMPRSLKLLKICKNATGT